MQENNVKRVIKLNFVSNLVTLSILFLSIMAVIVLRNLIFISAPSCVHCGLRHLEWSKNKQCLSAPMKFGDFENRV